MKQNHHANMSNPGPAGRVRRIFTALVASTVLAGVPATLFAQGTPVFSNIWNIASGSRYDVVSTASYWERGIAVNPVTGNIIYASRASSNHVTIVDGATGAFINSPPNEDEFGFGIGSGTLALVQVGVADDGAIYAANLCGNLQTSFLKVYRYASETATNFTTVYNSKAVTGFSEFTSGSTARIGDAFDIRGAGTDTQIILSGSSATNAVILTVDPAASEPTNFVAAELTFGPGISAGDFAKGISFGSRDTSTNLVYGKNGGSGNLRVASFTFTPGTPGSAGAGSLTLITTITVDANLTGLSVDATNKLLLGVVTPNSATAANHRTKIFDISNPTAPVTLVDTNQIGPISANVNVIGAADHANGLYVTLEPNNGIMCYQLTGFVTNLPPGIVSQPAGARVLTGGYYTMNASANGTAPLAYQWRMDGTPIGGANTNFLTLTGVTATGGGDYTVVVTNAYGSATSDVATVTIAPATLSTVSAPLWSLAVGSRAYLTADNTQRGLAYNPVNDHLLLASRTPSNSVFVLDAANGSHITNLDLSLVSGGFFPVNVIAASDDGAVFLAALSTSGADFKLYRYANDDPATLPETIYDAAFVGPLAVTGGRLGDVIAARGSGETQEVLLTSRNGTEVVIFTNDAFNVMTPVVVSVANVPAGFAGLGATFGKSNTFWGKASGSSLYLVQYDLAAGAAEVILTNFPSTTAAYSNLTAVGYSPPQDYLAFVDYASTPDNLQLFDVLDSTQEPKALDTEFFATDNANGNGTGAVAFNSTGDRVWALDSNNGLVALDVAPRLASQKIGSNLVLSWMGAGVLVSATNAAGPYSPVIGATSPHTNAISGVEFFRIQR